MKKRIGYLILYRFLKENGITDKYINNICCKKGIIFAKEKEKKILEELVDDYINKMRIDDFSSLFNCSQTSFYWLASIEGAEYWFKYYSKWNTYVNKLKSIGII